MFSYLKHHFGTFDDLPSDVTNVNLKGHNIGKFELSETFLYIQCRKSWLSTCKSVHSVIET